MQVVCQRLLLIASACVSLVLSLSPAEHEPERSVVERLRSATDDYARGRISGIGPNGEKYDRRQDLVAIGSEVRLAATTSGPTELAQLRGDLERAARAGVAFRDQALTAELLAFLGEIDLPRLEALCREDFRTQPTLVAGALAARASVCGITDEYERLAGAVSDMNAAGAWSESRVESDVQRMLVDLQVARHMKDELARCSGVERQFEIVLSRAIPGAMPMGLLSTRPWTARSTSARAARGVLIQLSAASPSTVARLLHAAPPRSFFPGANMITDDPALAQEFADRARASMISHMSPACREAFRLLPPR